MGYAVFLGVAAPLNTALAFHGDEGYELMKGLLCYDGVALYDPIWNDQPPLHTALLAVVFKLFGPNVLVARLLTVAFAGLLAGVLYELLRRTAGHWAALIGVAVLITLREVLQLSVSAMLEMPAMASGMAAVLLMQLFLERSRKGWLIASGIAMGCSLQVKLTSMIFMPMLGCQLLMGTFRKERGIPVHVGTQMEDDKSAVSIRRRKAGCVGQFFWAFGVWLGIIAVAFGFIRLFYPGESIELLLGTHFSETTRQAFWAEDHYGFDNKLLLNQYPVLIPALAGVLWILARRRWVHLMPVILFATVFVVHQVHRPYWSYYFLHFAIPMAWLSGVVIQELLRWIFSQDADALKKFPYKVFWGILLWSSLLALLVADCPLQFRHELVRIQHARRMEDSGLVKQLRGYKDRVEWIYTGQLVEAFHARLKVIPELAVIPRKRVKSGQIDGRKTLEVLKKYKPGLIMPGSYGDEPGWQEYLEGHYERIPHSSQIRQAIYVRRDLRAASGL